jgi:hypothetical protein
MDPRYELIRIMYDAGKISQLSDIFKYIPKTIVAYDAGMNLDQLSQRLRDPKKWVVRQLFRVGQLCDLTEDEMLRLAMEEVRAKKIIK